MGVDVLQGGGGGRPSEGEGERSWPGAGQMVGQRRGLEEGADEVWADLSQRSSMVSPGFPGSGCSS